MPAPVEGDELSVMLSERPSNGVILRGCLIRLLACEKQRAVMLRYAEASAFHVNQRRSLASTLRMTSTSVELMKHPSEVEPGAQRLAVHRPRRRAAGLGCRRGDGCPAIVDTLVVERSVRVEIDHRVHLTEH